jgi:hypothetical protein
VLNLDAEQELRDPRGYTRSAATQAQLLQAIGRVQGLLRPGDLVVDLLDPERVAGCAAGLEGVAWCPTPLALARLAESGATLPEAPPVELLRRVNERAFALGLGGAGFESVYLRDVEGVAAALAKGEGPWLLKRGLSFAGRGHRRLYGDLSEADRRWCHNAFRFGDGVVLEPLVEREEDFAQHGFVTRSGELRLGRPLRQHCDAKGRWVGASPQSASGSGRLSRTEEEGLRESALEAGRALAEAGYFGPFGVDAFRYSRRGERAFNPLVELNARYSMAWGLAVCSDAKT